MAKRAGSWTSRFTSGKELESSGTDFSRRFAESANQKQVIENTHYEYGATDNRELIDAEEMMSGHALKKRRHCYEQSNCAGPNIIGASETHVGSAQTLGEQKRWKE